MADVAAALAAARVLVAPPDHTSLAAADAHLRGVQDGPYGWSIGRALLGDGDVQVGVVGASLLRAKARAGKGGPLAPHVKPS